MKKLLILLVVLISGCLTPRYVYVVDDVYYSRPTERRPVEKRPHYVHRPMNMYRPVPPMMYWQMQQRKQVPLAGPRKQNLDSYRPQLPPPPPPPADKKEEQKEEVKKEAPVRKF